MNNEYDTNLCNKWIFNIKEFNKAYINDNTTDRLDLLVEYLYQVMREYQVAVAMDTYNTVKMIRSDMKVNHGDHGIHYVKCTVYHIDDRVLKVYFFDNTDNSYKFGIVNRHTLINNEVIPILGFDYYRDHEDGSGKLNTVMKIIDELNTVDLDRFTVKNLLQLKPTVI